MARTFLTDCHVALKGCRISRPRGFHGGVEVAWADVGLRSFPTRLSPGLGICLKTGPVHEPRANGRLTSIPADAIIVRPPGCVWSSPPVISGFVSIDIDPSLLPPDSHYRPMAAVAPHRFPPLVALLDSMMTTRSELLREQVLTDLIQAVYDQGLASSSAISGAELAPAALRRARDFLIDRFAASAGLDELARHVGANKFVLARGFRSCFGVTPHAFKVQVQVAHARTLLGRGVPINETALSVGFADQSHLGRHFKRHVGLTPAAYVRQVRTIAASPRRS